jgi:hypothetical protein
MAHRRSGNCPKKLADWKQAKNMLQNGWISE